MTTDKRRKIGTMQWLWAIVMGVVVLGCAPKPVNLEPDEVPIARSSSTPTVADDDDDEDEESDEPKFRDYDSEEEANSLHPSAVKDRLKKEIVPGSAGGDDKDKAKRDLDAEFRAAIGDPVSCLEDFDSDKATRLVFSVSGTARPTGSVGQVEVSGEKLPETSLKCLKRRGEAVRLQRLLDGEAALVTTTFEVDFEPTKYEMRAPDWDPIQPGQRKPSEPQRPTLAPSGQPIKKEPALPPPPVSGNPIKGPSGTPIQGPPGVPIGR